MKKLLLGFMLALSFGLACDVPYEEVGGIKIGCPLELSKNYKEVKGDDYSLIFSDKVYDYYGDVKFFDGVGVYIYEGKITGLTFVKNYTLNNKNKRQMQKEFVDDARNFASSLINKWGGFNGAKYENLLNNDPNQIANATDNSISLQDMLEERIYSSSPKSEVLGAIVMEMFDPDVDLTLWDDKKSSTIGFTITYLDKGAAQRLANYNKAQKASQTEGF